MNLSPQVGVILIGNELLSGQTQDLNLSHIAKKLRSIGICVRECIMIPDDEQVIIDTVLDYSKRFQYVFTTGGIGPTHDDITAASIAKAFGRTYEINQEATQLLHDRYGPDDFTDSRMRMAYMPSGVTIIHNQASAAPGFQIENVFVMAGIPAIMQSMMENVLTTLEHGAPLYHQEIFCDIPEGLMAEDLRSIQQAYPQIEIGSYPHWVEGHPHSLKVSVHGYDLGLVEEVCHKVQKAYEHKAMERKSRA